MTQRTSALVCLLAVLSLARCQCDDDLEKLHPDILVTPASINMGVLRVAEDTEAFIQVGNQGDASLTIKSVKIAAFEDKDGLLGDDLDLVDEGGVAFAIASAPESVKIDAVEDIVVLFTPPARGQFGGTVIIKTDDPDTGTVKVPIVGTAGTPAIEALPDAIDFGVVNEGPGATRVVQLRNSGHDVLSISDIYLEVTGLDGGVLGPFSLADDINTAPSIPVDDSLSLSIHMQPTAEMVAANGSPAFMTTLVVVSDAGNDPELRVPVVGEANLAPVARAVELISRLSEVKVGLNTEVIIDGSDTTDPEDDAFTFAWEIIESPDETALLFSDVTGPECETDIECATDEGYRCTDGSTRKCRQVAWTHLIPQSAGTYVIRLRVTDEHGAFSDAEARVLPKDFVVLLRWEPQPGSICTTISEDDCDALPPTEQFCPCGQSDLDLHLMRPELPSDVAYGLGDYSDCPDGCVETVSVDGGPSTLVNYCAEADDSHVDTCRQSGSDCAYANRYPEWGVAGRADDPRLDIDDVQGAGPEAITLNGPIDGTYLAAIHYCNDRIDAEPTMATLEVYVEGVLTLTAGPQLINEGEVWYAASMTRTGGAVDGAWDLTALAPVVSDVGVELCAF